MKGHFTARRRWLAGAAALASIVAAACRDAISAPGGSPRPVAQSGPLVNRTGESSDIEIYIPADLLKGENSVNFDSSVNFRHTTYVRATVSGSVSQSSQWPMYFPAHTWTADQLSDGVSVSTTSYGPYPIPSAGVDIGFAPSLHTPNIASFGRLGHPVRTWDYYTPDGYPHVECGWTDQPPCVTYEGGFTVKLVPYKADLAIALDSTSYLPGSRAAVHVWVPDSLQGSPDLHPMNWDQDSIAWSSDVPGETGIDRNWSNCKLPNPCTHVVKGDADWTITGYVNGAFKSKTVHVKMAKAKLTVMPASGPRNFVATFAASWDDGHTLNPADVTGWAWVPDSVPSEQTTPCDAGQTGCQRKVKSSGNMVVTMKHGGVETSASAHVQVIPDCPPPTGDSILAQPEVLSSLSLLWSSHREPNVMDRREQLGVVLYNPTTRQYSVWIKGDLTSSTPCHVDPDQPPSSDIPPGFFVLALLHNHPIDPGTDPVPPNTSCNKSKTLTGHALPGLSPGDSGTAHTGFPVYGMDNINIYSLPASGPGQTIPRYGANGCSLVPLLQRKRSGVKLAQSADGDWVAGAIQLQPVEF